MESNRFDLTGEVALITGTSHGLAQYFARELARANRPTWMERSSSWLPTLARMSLPRPC
jgi:short-subunit dehydrogenase